MDAEEGSWQGRATNCHSISGRSGKRKNRQREVEGCGIHRSSGAEHLTSTAGLTSQRHTVPQKVCGELDILQTAMSEWHDLLLDYFNSNTTSKRKNAFYLLKWL